MKLIKQFFPNGKKQALSRAMTTFGLHQSFRYLPVWSGLLVLNYHRIGRARDCAFDQNLYSADAEDLERQIRLYKRHADVIGVSELDQALESRSGKYVLITFDDGYRDNYELAYPVLKQTETPAVFFIANQFIDHPCVAWWDEIAWIIRNAKVDALPTSRWFPQGLKIEAAHPQPSIGVAVRRFWSLRGTDTEAYLEGLGQQARTGRCPNELAREMWMTWEMIQEVSKAGVEIGGHTVSHPILAQQSAEIQREEIVVNRKRLQEQLGFQPVAFAYPVGQAHMYTEITKEILQEAGYRYAFSFHGHYQPHHSVDRLDIPRTAIDHGLPLTMLESRLSLPQVFARK